MMAEIADDVERFDEHWYLRANPDVAEAVVNGVQKSGLSHYLRFGRNEGRRPCAGFDAAWYAQSYQFAVEEVGSTDPAALEFHYQTVGRFRGYLPQSNADRMYETAPEAGFSCLWVDLPNASDLVHGKRAIGLIDAEEERLLNDFIRDGYAILPNAIPTPLIDRADEVLEIAYMGAFSNVEFECHTVSNVAVPWSAVMREQPAKLLDLHWFREEVRDLIFAGPLVRLLNLIFERPVLATQTLGFYRGSGQPLHQDSAYVAYSRSGQFVASWIALEDVAPGAGELEYFAGSHRALPPFFYPGDVRSMWEADRLGQPRELVGSEARRHEHSLEIEGARLGLDRRIFQARKGDVLIWHPDLAHGGRPTSLSKTRKSFVTHYCPREIVPLYFERNKPHVIKQHGSSFYTTAQY